MAEVKQLTQIFYYGQSINRTRSTKVHDFGLGWTDLIKQHNLNVSKFLIFMYEGDMVLGVIAFDPIVCEKKP